MRKETFALNLKVRKMISKYWIVMGGQEAIENCYEVLSQNSYIGAIEIVNVLLD